MPSNALPSSTLELSSLQPNDAPSMVDVRPLLNTVRDPNAVQAFTLIQQAIDVIQQVLRSVPPRLESISIGSADIEDLTVSGEFGPGSFIVLNGPPNFDQIGWIGSQASAASVTITNITAGLVTTAAPHELKIGDNVYIEQTTAVGNTGFYVVATTPTITTFTVTGGIPGGNSTGGSMTKQFQGMWVKTFAAGGTAFDNAPFRVDVDGSVTIENATIIMTGTSSSIVLDPNTGSIIVTDTSGPPPHDQIEITSGQIFMRQVGAGAGPEVSVMASGSILLSGDVTNGYQISISTGSNASLVTVFGLADTFAKSQQVSLFGYAAASTNGPIVSTFQARGSGSAATATQSGDTIGGLIASSFDGTDYGGAYAAGIRVTATENAAAAQHGAQVVIETTPNGTNVPSNVTTFGQDGSLDVPLKYMVGGAPGITATRARGTSVSLSTSAVGVFGTPSVGQSNGTVVTGVTLTTSNDTFTGGILTA